MSRERYTDTIDKYFQPTISSFLYNRDHEALLAAGLGRIEQAISSLPGDPGKVYPLDERVRRVIGALQADIILAKGSRR